MTYVSPFEENADPKQCGHPFVDPSLPENVKTLPGVKPRFYKCVGCGSVLDREAWEACSVGETPVITLGIPSEKK
jgi:hypothetical protein